MRGDCLSSDFNKSNPSSEVVLLNPPQATLNNRSEYYVSEENWSIFKSEVDDAINSRPNMRLAGIQNIDKATDALGNIRNHTIGYMLIFEQKERTLSEIRSELEELNEKTESLRSMFENWGR